MPGANGHGDAEPGALDASDPLAPIIQAVLSAAGLPAPELARRIREAFPSAIAEIADLNRRLREITHRREALVAAAAAELRAAADTLATGEQAARLDEATRLRRIADDLERALRPVEGAGPIRRLPARGGGRPRVLVADDDRDTREVLVGALEDECDVLEAANGEEAVELAATEHPDVVLMDLFMPKLDGLQALEHIRADPATADVQVIFVSARGDDAVKARALDLGAVDYLQKPFSGRELRARVERSLRLAQSQTALREQAQTDPLTGLANLRAFRTRIEDEMKRARRYRTPLTCVMADMDHLKPINDELGHAAGDRAIAAVAAVVRAELRETDFGARYGGDEFVILLPHTGTDEGRIFAERVCARLRETVLEIAGRKIPLGASFGVSCFPGDPEADGSHENLVRAADAALYRAKRAGRGRVELALPSDSGADAAREHA